MPKTRVLMVCLGNICRSPLAEGIFRTMVQQRGLSDQIEVDSAGTADYHEGEAPHVGSLAVAARHDIDISAQRARTVTPADFGAFDWFLAMDTSNRNALRHRAPDGFALGRIRLLLEFAEFGPKEVPDPYYTNGFDEVFDLITAGCAGFLDRLTTGPGIAPEP